MPTTPTVSPLRVLGPLDFSRGWFQVHGPRGRLVAILERYAEVLDWLRVRQLERSPHAVRTFRVVWYDPRRGPAPVRRWRVVLDARGMRWFPV
jgi:hypothetical protein